MSFSPLEKIWERIDIARQDSDTSLFHDLLYAGEMVTKLVAAGLVAAVGDDRSRHRYGQLYRLVRADGLGDWRAAIDDVLTGPASQYLLPQARTEQRELTQRCGPQTWQYESACLLHNSLRIVDPTCESLPAKVEGRRWFSMFVELRNKTRGHGALRTDLCGRLCPDLESSIRIVADNFCLFQRQWAYLHRNLSGKYRVTRLTEDASSFDFLKLSRSESVPNGVYIHLDQPAMVELVTSDVDAADFFFPNGAFDGKHFGLLSYISGTMRDSDAAPYMVPASELPASETQGIGVLDVQGSCFGNLPPVPRGYIHRSVLEHELFDTLMDERHPIITLVGMGGIGKTSLALSVLHKVAEQDRFDAIVWFSARDIDLLPTGPRVVHPHVLTIKDIAAELVRLVRPQRAEEKGFQAVSYLEEALQKGLTGPTLFVFDNFETVNSPTDIFSRIDTFVRPRNKVLITTRHRDFKGDYYVEVSGMTEPECVELIDSASAELGIQPILTEQYRRELYSESNGHPYVIKILLGEVAKAGKLVKVERIVAGRDETLNALFERTFSRLSERAKRVFLTLCNWRSTVPQLAVEAVLLRPANEKMDVADAIEELRRSSFVEVTVSEKDEMEFLNVPLAASLFGKPKLAVSPMRSAVEADTQLLHTFGAAQPLDIRQGVRPRVERMFKHVAAVVNQKPGEINGQLPMLEFVARKHPPAWLLLADLHEETGTTHGLENAKDAVRRFLESTPAGVDQQQAWDRLAMLCRRTNDWLGEIHALLQMSELPGTEFDTISGAANRLNGFFRQKNFVLDTDEKQIVVRRLAEVMEGRISEGDATDCSRLAWLHLHLHDDEGARRLVERGLVLDPDNEYCQNLATTLSSGQSVYDARR